MSLPAADDLFRPGPATAAEPASAQAEVEAAPAPVRAVAAAPERPRRSSGRVRHDEKMTVYVTSAELLEIEHARLLLRSEHGLAVDRGRLVREALSIALADLETEGADSALLRRLTEE